jgi:hypothetical protein
VDASAFLLGFTCGGECVGCFAGLGNRNEEIVLPDERIAVPKLTADVDLDRRPNHFLQQIFANQSRMPRRPAGHDPDSIHGQKLACRQTDVGEVRFAGFIRIAAAHRIENRLRLLVDLFQHEMRVSAFLRRRGVPCDA